MRNGKNVIRKTMAALVALGIALAPMETFAAPRRMADGGVFDAEYYAATYPDVAQAVGTDEAALYQHYKTCGRLEGRNPFSAETVPIDLESKLPALKAKYPEGMQWTNSNGYQNPIAAPWVNYYGCAAFAMVMSDEIYGKDAPMVELHPESSAALRPGDIVRVLNNSHSVFVLSVDSQYITVCEGNYGGTVHWGGRYLRSALDGDISWVDRRIPIQTGS